MNNKTKDLKTVAFTAAGMFLAYWIYSIFIEIIFLSMLI